jgi:hypothetical protein
MPGQGIVRWPPRRRRAARTISRPSSRGKKVFRDTIAPLLVFPLCPHHLRIYAQKDMQIDVTDRGQNLQELRSKVCQHIFPRSSWLYRSQMAPLALAAPGRSATSHQCHHTKDLNVRVDYEFCQWDWCGGSCPSEGVKGWLPKWGYKHRCCKACNSTVSLSHTPHAQAWEYTEQRLPERLKKRRNLIAAWATGRNSLKSPPS